MKVGIIALALAFLVGLPFAAMSGPDTDTDGDGSPDVFDTCTVVSQTSALYGQHDTDGDGCGNICDGDIDQDNNRGVSDILFQLNVCFGVSCDPKNPNPCCECDIDEDETCGVSDILKNLNVNFGSPPGPGAHCCTGQGTVGCP